MGSWENKWEPGILGSFGTKNNPKSEKYFSGREIFAPRSYMGRKKKSLELEPGEGKGQGRDT